MLHYKDAKTGNVFAYQSQVEREQYGSKDLVELTPEEVDAILNPPKTDTAESLKAEVTQKRWEVETGGLTLPIGVRVATGVDDQNRITSVIANAELAGVEEVDFKAESGWERVSVDGLRSIAAAIARHVQACFSAERAHHEAIDAIASQHSGEALQDALKSYDVTQGWPAAVL